MKNLNDLLNSSLFSCESEPEYISPVFYESKDLEFFDIYRKVCAFFNMDEDYCRSKTRSRDSLKVKHFSVIIGMSVIVGIKHRNCFKALNRDRSRVYTIIGAAKSLLKIYPEYQKELMDCASYICENKYYNYKHKITLFINS